MKDTPIAYCDTSFILDYWEAYVYNEKYSLDNLFKENRPKHYEFIKSIINTENRIESLKPMRRLIDKNALNIELVSSTFALIEVFEKYAEFNLKAIIAESTKVNRALNKGKKQIGDFIKKIYESKDAESVNVFDALYPRNLREDLFGIEFKDLKNFNLSVLDVYKKYSFFSVLQVGIADILHLLAAKKLKANYFLTFDNDYVRIKDIIENKLKMQLISNPSELNNLIKTHTQK